MVMAAFQPTKGGSNKEEGSLSLLFVPPPSKTIFSPAPPPPLCGSDVPYCRNIKVVSPYKQRGKGGRKLGNTSVCGWVCLSVQSDFKERRNKEPIFQYCCWQQRWQSRDNHPTTEKKNFFREGKRWRIFVWEAPKVGGGGDRGGEGVNCARLMRRRHKLAVRWP